MKGIIIILGSPNDENGNLSEIAIGRNQKGIDEYQNHPGYKILVTGGFGEHFNTTNKPHAYYAKQFLLKNGVPEKEILEFAESRNTVEDALLSKKIVIKYGITNLIIVTSDFHIKRVKLIFRLVFKKYNLIFFFSKDRFYRREI